MCCDGLSKDWWVDVHAGGRVVSFQSEQAAKQFLEQDVREVPVESHSLYVALKRRMEEDRQLSYGGMGQ